MPQLRMSFKYICVPMIVLIIWCCQRVSILKWRCCCIGAFRSGGALRGERKKGCPTLFFRSIITTIWTYAVVEYFWLPWKGLFWPSGFSDTWDSKYKYRHARNYIYLQHTAFYTYRTCRLTGVSKWSDPARLMICNDVLQLISYTEYIL